MTNMFLYFEFLYLQTMKDAVIFYSYCGLLKELSVYLNVMATSDCNYESALFCFVQNFCSFFFNFIDVLMLMQASSIYLKCCKGNIYEVLRCLNQRL